MSHERIAAELLEIAAQFVLASEHNEAITAMDLALTEVQLGLLDKYAKDHTY